MSLISFGQIRSAAFGTKTLIATRRVRLNASKVRTDEYRLFRARHGGWLVEGPDGLSGFDVGEDEHYAPGHYVAFPGLGCDFAVHEDLLNEAFYDIKAIAVEDAIVL